MAPEQIRNSADIDGRADLYALALVGYYLLTGSEPFTADTPMNSLLLHLEQEAPVYYPGSSVACGSSNDAVIGSVYGEKSG